MDMVSRIREEMEAQGIKQKDLVQRLGASQSNVSKWLSKNEKIRLDIPITVLFDIARILDVDAEYIIGAQDKKKSKVYNFADVGLESIAGEQHVRYSYHNKDSVQTDESYIELPTIHAGAGAIGYAVDVPEHRAYPKELIPTNVALDENVLVIIVAGNSMEPLYYENDVVFIDMVNGREFTQIDGTYLVRYGDTVQIKDVTFLGNGDIMISSRNNNQRIKIKEDLGIDDWEIVGKPYVLLHATVGSKLMIERKG